MPWGETGSYHFTDPKSSAVSLRTGTIQIKQLSECFCPPLLTIKREVFLINVLAACEKQLSSCSGPHAGNVNKSLEGYAA